MMASRSVAFALLLSVVAAVPVEALRFYVDPTTGDDRRSHYLVQDEATPWKTIAHALRVAHLVKEGRPHVIDIAPGTYSPASGETFPLVIRQTGIHLRSQGNVILDAQQRSGIVDITAAGANVALRNFSLVNGLADRGGAVFCQSCTLRVVSSRLLNNVSTAGGDAIYVADGRLEMTNDILRFNGLDGAAGPIVEVRNTFADTSQRDVIRNNTFFHNRTAAVLTTGNRTDISSNIFVGTPGDGVAAIVDSVVGDEPLVRYNLFWDTDILYLSDDRDSIEVGRTVRDTLTLEEQGVTVPSFVTNVPDTVAQVGVPYQFDIQVEGDRDNYKFTVINGTDIPAGMSEGDTGTGVLSWTPGDDQLGKNAVRLEIIRTSPSPPRQEFLSYVITVFTAEDFPDTTTPAPVITVSTVPDTVGAIDSLNSVVPSFSHAASAGSNAYGDPLFLNPDINRFELLVSRVRTLDDGSLDTLTSLARDAGNPVVALDDAVTAGGSLRNDIGFTGGPVTVGSPLPGSATGTAVTNVPDSLAVEGQPWTYAPAFDPTRNIIITDPIHSAQVSLPPTFAAAFGKKPPVTWTPAVADTGSWFVGVESFFVGGSVKHYFALRVRAVNAPPRVTSTPPATAAEDAPFVYAIRAVDDDGDSLSWQVQSGPTGLTVDSLGVVRWVPQQADVGTADVVIGLTDARGASNTHAFSLTVTNSNDPPVATVVGDTVAVEDRFLQLQLAATDPDPGDTVFTFSLTAAPDSARIDSLDRLLWTPRQADVGDAHVVTVRVADAAGSADSTSFAITVVEVDDPPAIVGEPDTVALEDTRYTAVVEGQDEEGQPLSYRLVSAPAGMTIDSTGTLDWTPAIADTGLHPVTVEVADPGGQTAEQTFQLRVLPVNDPPVILTRVPADTLILVAPGVGLTFSLEAADEEGDLLTLEWLVNGSVSARTPTFLLVPDTTAADTVVARVLDGTDTTTTRWIVDARAIAKITVTTDPVDFGRVILGDSSVVVLKVANPGRSTLRLSDLQVGNLAFRALFGTDAVATDDSTALTLSFRPTSRGVQVSAVQFATNDPDRATVVIPVRGVGGVATTAALDTRLDPGDQEERTGLARLGDTLRVDVELHRVTEVADAGIDLGFDAEVLSFAGFTVDTAFLGAEASAASAAAAGTARIDISGAGSASGDGALGRAAFVVAADAVLGSTTGLDLISVRLRSTGQTLTDTLADLEGVTFELAAPEPGDVSGDGIVDLSDFFLFADDFGSSAARSDFNADGVVDLVDFFVFADAFDAAARPLAVAAEGVEGLQLWTAARPVDAARVAVDVLWRGDGDLRGAGLWVTFDPRHLAFETAQTPNDGAEGLAWTRPGGPGRIEVVLAPTGGAAFAGDVGRLTFRRLDAAATRVGVVAAVGRDAAGALTPMSPPSLVAVAALPRIAVLYPAQPNPFNPETVIPLFVPRGQEEGVTVRVFDLLGRPVRTLANGDLPAGYQRLVWRGRDDTGRPVGAGVYLVELRAADRRQVRKVLLLK